MGKSGSKKPHKTVKAAKKPVDVDSKRKDALTSTLVGLYVRHLITQSEMLLNCSMITDDNYCAGVDNYYNMMSAPLKFVTFTLATFPPASKRSDSKSWKEVLSILYNRKKIDDEEERLHGNLFLGNSFAENASGGYSVDIPDLSKEEAALIEPFADKITPQFEKKYDTFKKQPKSKEWYLWRKDYDKERDQYREGICDEIEYFTRTIWDKIHELTPLLHNDHGMCLTPPTRFIPERTEM